MDQLDAEEWLEAQLGNPQGHTLINATSNSPKDSINGVSENIDTSLGKTGKLMPVYWKKQRSPLWK